MKIKKKKLIMVLTLIMVISTSIIASADTKEGSLSGRGVTASSNITAVQASASTSMNIAPYSGSTVSVSATYSYVNYKTMDTGIRNNGSNGINGCGINFTAPKDCRSVRIIASHTAYYDSQSWKASTGEIY